jgi:transcriptional regulator with PAS, ATPase and Fis domain
MSLLEVKKSVQKVADAISLVLGVEVTIIDENYIRVAATGKYRKLIGNRIPSNSVFEAIILDKSPKYIGQTNFDLFCKKCSAKNICNELATIGYPIIKDDKVIGIIGIIAFEESQRQRILNNHKSLINFLDKLSNLMVGTLSSHETIQKLKIQTEETKKIIDSFRYGILCLDNNGDIKYINKKAENILDTDKEKVVNNNIENIIPEVSSSIFEVNQLEKKINIKSKRLSIFIRNNPVMLQGKRVSNIIELHKTSDIIHDAYQIFEEKKNINFNDIIGESSKLKDVKNIAKQVANTDSTVMLYGESGTGKELFARAIHFDSKRCDSPFIAINCASIPDNLLESELFGYEGGAFSGARKEGQMGKFELANGGTVFLDEIGDMPLHLQPKILRVLQNHSFTRIGGKELIIVDIRIIAATNRNLEQMIKNGEFREDLYYRLSVIPISLPPLRERENDILLLSSFFLNKYCNKLNTIPKNFSEEVKHIFLSYPWPGNIRELENAIEYMVNISKGDLITPEYLPVTIKEKNEDGSVWQNR